jgi:hypothetical protein
MKIEKLIRKSISEEDRIRPIVKRPEDCLIIKVRQMRAALVAPQ